MIEKPKLTVLNSQNKEASGLRPNQSVAPVLILLPTGLLSIVGGSITALTCARFHQVGTDNNGGTQSLNRPCGPGCVMFSPPYTHDGLGVIELCDGKVLKAKRLLDLTGEICDINVANATTEELFQWLQQKGILSLQAPETPK